MGFWHVIECSVIVFCLAHEMLRNLLFALAWKLESVSDCQTNYLGFLLSVVTRNPDKVQTRKWLDFFFKSYLYGKKPQYELTTDKCSCYPSLRSWSHVLIFKTINFPMVWLRSAKAIDKSLFPVMGLDSVSNYHPTALCVTDHRLFRKQDFKKTV